MSEQAQRFGRTIVFWAGALGVVASVASTWLILPQRTEMSQISLTKWSAGWPYSTLEDGVTPIWQDTTPLAQGGSGNTALGEAVWNNLTDLFRQNFSREPLSSELDPWYASFWDSNAFKRHSHEPRIQP